MAGHLILPAPAEGWHASRSGVLVPGAGPDERRPVAIDLFCGCGGMSLGVMQAGFEVLAGMDNDPIAAMTYLDNLGSYPVDIQFATPEDRERLEAAIEKEWRRQEKQGGGIEMTVSGSNWRQEWGVPVRHFFFGDCRQWTGERILGSLGLRRGDVDLVCGGPPCQGFSVAGQRNIVDPRNSLVFEFARLVVEIFPRTMVLENVPGILSMRTSEGLPVVDALCRILADGSFGVYDALRNSLRVTAGAGAVIRNTPRDEDPDEDDDDPRARGRSKRPLKVARKAPRQIPLAGLTR